jgi:hypothetical protein
MGKFKAYRGQKRATRQPANAVPCLIIIALGMALVLLLFYSVLRSS